MRAIGTAFSFLALSSFWHVERSSPLTEILPYGSDGRPTYTGWYFDLFADRTDAIAHPELSADFFTSTAGVGYIGVTPPQLGLFVVDTGGGPRVVVGPVAHPYEHQGGSGRRLDDDAARALPAAAVQQEPAEQPSE